MRIKSIVLTVGVALALVSPAVAEEKLGAFGEPPRGWEGLRVGVLGDSITDKGQTRAQNNVYWQYLSAWLKWDVRVYGRSGNTWRDIPKQTDRMIGEMGDDVDTVLIFVGTNDYAHGDPLGDWYETEKSSVSWYGKDQALEHRRLSFATNTVRGRINLALSKIKRRYPRSQVVVLTPIHRAFFQCSPTNIQPAEDWPNTLGLHLEEYVACVREGAAIWSCPVIDLYAESGLTPLLGDEYAAYYRNREKDLLHPNSEGHRRLADLVYCRLRALPATFRR